MDDSDGELLSMFDRSYQIEESCFSLDFHYASLGICPKQSIQWVSGVVFVTTFLTNCTFKEHMVNDQCLTTMVASSRGSTGQDMGLDGPGMAN